MTYTELWVSTASLPVLTPFSATGSCQGPRFIACPAGKHHDNIWRISLNSSHDENVTFSSYILATFLSNQFSTPYIEPKPFNFFIETQSDVQRQRKNQTANNQEANIVTPITIRQRPTP
ncbi:uncharacterized protein BDR25DRAFT_360979 [Lindgomyces ingoldianus]|uniref:Uncharacterized protein n=1 Tax=Lindgomyces ingoldianus TaxID=673940 RepID=A0ACB6QDL5_9PLEO|nr:uncharacterized protein BDR25DRAFT_360979 [Lindgomyces ingoldianus]KAF2465079.1 hypothetical protein BDR25DRAFT_360979 [Lindgomyces ingoldianus]